MIVKPVRILQGELKMRESITIMCMLMVALSADSIEPLDLDLLRLDFTNCRCSVVCCRLGQEVLELFDATFPHRHPKRIEIVGALDWEQAAMTAAMKDIQEKNACPNGRIVFIDCAPTPGD